MVTLGSLRSLRSLRIFSVDTMCVNRQEVTVVDFFFKLVIYSNLDMTFDSDLLTRWITIFNSFFFQNT